MFSKILAPTLGSNPVESKLCCRLLLTKIEIKAKFWPLKYVVQSKLLPDSEHWYILNCSSDSLVWFILYCCISLLSPFSIHTCSATKEYKCLVFSRVPSSLLLEKFFPRTLTLTKIWLPYHVWISVCVMCHAKKAQIITCDCNEWVIPLYKVNIHSNYCFRKLWPLSLQFAGVRGYLAEKKNRKNLFVVCKYINSKNALFGI